MRRLNVKPEKVYSASPLSLICTATRFSRYYLETNIQLDLEKDPENCQKFRGGTYEYQFLRASDSPKIYALYQPSLSRRDTLCIHSFKSTIQDGTRAPWNCVKYIELNPVRTSLSKSSEDYRICTWGHYCGCGKHFFGNNFVRHMRKRLREAAENWTDEEGYGGFFGKLRAQ